jgi:hypothetical protein
MNTQIKQWVIGVLAVISFIYGLALFGEAFRAYTLPRTGLEQKSREFAKKGSELYMS